MSAETSYVDFQLLDTTEPSLLTHASEVCLAVIPTEILTEAGTVTENGGSSLFGEVLTDQSDNPLLT